MQTQEWQARVDSLLEISRRYFEAPLPDFEHPAVLDERRPEAQAGGRGRFLLRRLIAQRLAEPMMQIALRRRR